MLDIRLIRKEKDAIETKLCNKVSGIDLSPIVAKDEEIRHIKALSEELKARRNAASLSIVEKKKEGKDTTDILQEMASISDQITDMDGKVRVLEEQLHQMLAYLPNIPFDDVPVSPSPKDNVMLRSFGKKPSFAFVPKNHVQLNESLHLFDFERAAKIAGSGFVSYKGLGARLEWALLNYMIDFHVKRGYVQWIPPVVVKRDMLYAAGQLPKFENQQYRVLDDDQELFMIPTAEVALNGLYSEEILPIEELPMKCIAYTPCFRREAGAAGSNERGLIRTHQFNKVEMFAFTTEDQSAEVFEQFVEAAEGILKGLNMHHRSMLLTTGDMSFAAAKTIDIEVYLPGQERYYEVSSVSNCTDFQSRRSNTRYRRGKEKPSFIHTLNGSGLATSRLMVALLENNQQEDGSVLIPEALQPYMGGLSVLK